MGMNGIYPNNPLVSGQIGFGPYIPQPVYWQPQPMPMPQQSQAPHMEVCPVNGKEGALAFSIGPNSSVILPDSVQPKIWVLTTDASGTKAVKGFRIIEDEEEIPEKQDDPIAKLNERLLKLEERMECYGQPDSGSADESKSYRSNNRSDIRSGAEISKPDSGT